MSIVTLAVLAVSFGLLGAMVAPVRVRRRGSTSKAKAPADFASLPTRVLTLAP